MSFYDDTSAYMRALAAKHVAQSGAQFWPEVDDAPALLLYGTERMMGVEPALDYRAVFMALADTPTFDLTALHSRILQRLADVGEGEDAAFRLYLFVPPGVQPAWLEHLPGFLTQRGTLSVLGIDLTTTTDDPAAETVCTVTTLQPGIMQFTIEEHGEAVGSCQLILVPDPAYALVSDLQVEPDYSGRGLERLLLHRAHAEARAYGATRVLMLEAAFTPAEYTPAATRLTFWGWAVGG